MKAIKILLIVIIILAALLGLKIYNENKEPEYTLKDIQEILKKSEQLINYECAINLGQFKYYKRKDNKIFLQSDTDYTVYRDYDKKIEIVCKFFDNKKVYIEKELEKDEIPSSNLYTATFSADELLTLGVKIKSVKKESECLKVEFENKNNQTYTFWINNNNGLIMKAGLLKDGTIKEYTYKFDTVADEDVTPNLIGYTKLKTDL